jgi:hypothetical protein
MCDGVVVAEAMGLARFQDNRQDEGSTVPTWSSTLLQYVLWVELDNEGVGRLTKVNDAWTQPLRLWMTPYVDRVAGPTCR